MAKFIIALFLACVGVAVAVPSPGGTAPVAEIAATPALGTPDKSAATPFLPVGKVVATPEAGATDLDAAGFWGWGLGYGLGYGSYGGYYGGYGGYPYGGYRYGGYPYGGYGYYG